jgi:hypothetical protein
MAVRILGGVPEEGGDRAGLVHVLHESSEVVPPDSVNDQGVAVVPLPKQMLVAEAVALMCGVAALY